ncbi:extracellular solute-binding protein 3 [Tanacetum coccineum]|uniref:Extracellular solute-binding protein 3 n=1 Tax=Tanacetum coccineum TaxID=301880 RepID=A0ABQ5FPA2_9ASTR
MADKGISPCSPLVVRVPQKVGFTEFVNVNENSEVEDGFSIAIPYNVQPIFKVESIDSYDKLLRKIEGQKCEAVAGDVTMRGTRAQYVSFTIPYLNSDVYMLVRESEKVRSKGCIGSV